MIVKATKTFNCVLLDAMIVIEAHALGNWDNILRQVQVLIPSTVVKDEAFYFFIRKSEKDATPFYSVNRSSQGKSYR